MAEETSPISSAYSSFHRAAGYAGLFELRIRFLANKEKTTERFSFESSFGTVVSKVTEHFSKSGYLRPVEAELFAVAKKLRDKLLHAELRALISIIEKNFGILPGPSVVHGKFSGDSEKMLQELQDIVDGHSSSTVDTQSFKRIGHFGFFLEAYQRGALDKASVIFSNAIYVVDCVSELHARKGPTKS